METHFNIKAVERITGLTQHVIRAWEKRYHVVEPLRSETNRRVYTDLHVKKLKLLKQLTDAGHTIRHIAPLNVLELERLLKDSQPLHPSTLNKALPEEIISECVAHIHQFNSEAIIHRLETSVHQYGQLPFLKSIVVPLLEQIGEDWAHGKMRIAHEHFISNILKAMLLNLLYSNPIAENSKSVVLATPQGELHELSCLVGAVISSAFGFKSIYLGASVVVEELLFSTKQTKTALLYLGIVYPHNLDQLIEIIRKTRVYMDSECQLVVSCSQDELRVQVEQMEGVVCIRSQDEFIEILQHLPNI